MKKTSLKKLNRLIDNDLPEYKHYDIQKKMREQPDLRKEYTNLKKLKKLISSLAPVLPSKKYDDVLREKLATVTFKKPLIISLPQIDFNLQKLSLAVGSIGLIMGIFFASMFVFDQNNLFPDGNISIGQNLSNKYTSTSRTAKQPEIYYETVPPTMQIDNKKSSSYNDSENYLNLNTFNNFKCGRLLESYLETTQKVPDDYTNLIKSFLAKENLFLGEYYFKNDDKQKAIEFLNNVISEAPDTQDAKKAKKLLLGTVSNK